MSPFCFHSRPGPQFFQMIQLLPAHRCRRSPLSQNFCRCRAVSCEGKSDSCFQLHQPANGKTADSSSEELRNCLQQSSTHTQTRTKTLDCDSFLNLKELILSGCRSLNDLLHSKACSHVSRVCIVCRVKQNGSDTLTYSTRRTWQKNLRRNRSEPTSGLVAGSKAHSGLANSLSGCKATWTTVHMRHFLFNYLCMFSFSTHPWNVLLFVCFFSKQCHFWVCILQDTSLFVRCVHLTAGPKVCLGFSRVCHVDTTLRGCILWYEVCFHLEDKTTSLNETAQ